MPIDQGDSLETQESLLVRLSPEELVRKGEQLARLLQSTATLRADAKKHAKLVAEQLKEQEDEAAALAQEISAGAELREVRCFERPRVDALLVDIVRADTGEVIRSRAMQPHERQQPLSWGDDDREDPNPRAH